MKNFKKTIAFMLVAYFVGLAIILYDFSVSYAASFSDVPDADWIYISGGNINNTELNKGVLDCPSRSLPDGRPSVFVDIPNCKYSETLAYYDIQSDYFEGDNITLSSDNEVVLVLDYVNSVPGYKAGTLNLIAFSKSCIYFADKGNWHDEGAWSDHGSAGKVDFTTNIYDNSGFYMLKLLNAYTSSDTSSLEFAFMTGKMKVFNTINGAISYLKDGSLSDLAWQGSKPKQAYNKEVHFDSFNMDVHASNNLDNYYIDFRYQLPNSLLGKGYSLRIDSTYRREVTNTITGESLFSKDYTDYQFVTLSDNPFSCRIYLKDFNSVKASFKDKYNDPFSKFMDVTSKNYDSVFLGITSHIDQIGYDVTLSLLSFSCKLETSGSRGYAYDGSLNLLTGANDIGSYTPDSNGTYKPNNDYRQNGYYYTEVTTDAAENTTYNYYYITNDNSRTEITKDENDNNSKSGDGIGNNSSSSASTSGNITNNNSPTFNNNNNITIEGDSINNEVNNIVDSSTSAEDNKSFIEKFLGFFQLLENNSFLGVWGKVFGWLPPGISSVITTALGISAGIGIFRFFRR